MIETTYTVYQPDGSSYEGCIMWPKEPGYDLIREFVEPILHADLEHVAVLYKGKKADMFVDDTGALKKLPINKAASDIYRAAYLKRYPDVDPENLSAIHGIAILFDRIVWY